VIVLGVHAAGTTWIAVLGALTFFLTIVELVVEWRRRAWSHADAARRLAVLKSQFRRATVQANGVESDGTDLDAAYDDTMAAIVEIPNRDFVPLKARHRRKVALSRLIDQHPGAPRLYLACLVRLDGVRGSTRPPSGVLEPAPPEAGGSVAEGSIAERELPPEDERGTAEHP
jgi:hypothetical protein